MKRLDPGHLALLSAAVNTRSVLRQLTERLAGEDRDLAVKATAMICAGLKGRTYRSREMAETGRPAR